MSRVAQIYGAHPLHLASLLLSFAVAGYAALQLFAADLIGVAVWFLGAAILHDLVVLPGYVLVDRLVRGRPPDAAERRAPLGELCAGPAGAVGLVAACVSAIDSAAQ
jgi:hypothetical protein